MAQPFYSCCVRLQKRTACNLTGMSAHNLRETPPEHADPSRARKNVTLKGGDTPIDQLVRHRIEQLRITPRRNAVLALELVLVVGEPFFAKVDKLQYAKESLAWLERVFGPENVVSFTLHDDESVPYPHAAIVPITDGGRLSCKAVLEQDRELEPADPDGRRRGNPTRRFFQRLQREHFELCKGLDHDVSPPVPGGTADYLATARWRGRQKQADQEREQLPEISVQPPTMAERLSPLAYARSEVAADRRRCLPVVSRWHAKAVERDDLQKRNQHLELSLRKLRTELDQKNQSLNQFNDLVTSLRDKLTDASRKTIANALGLPVHQTATGEAVLSPLGRVDHLTPPTPSSAGAMLGSLEWLQELAGVREDELKPWLLAHLGRDETLRALAWRQRAELTKELIFL